MYSAVVLKHPLNHIFVPVCTLVDSKKSNLKLSGMIIGKMREGSGVPILCFCYSHIEFIFVLYLFSALLSH